MDQRGVILIDEAAYEMAENVAQPLWILPDPMVAPMLVRHYRWIPAKEKGEVDDNMFSDMPPLEVREEIVD